MEGANKNILKLCVLKPSKSITSWTNMLRHDVILKAGSVREVDCPICLQALVAPQDVVVYLNHCQHQCHLSCLKVLYQMNGEILKCPLCRYQYELPSADFSEHGNIYVYVLENMVKIEFEYFTSVLHIIEMERNDGTIEVAARLLKAWKLGNMPHSMSITLLKCDLESIKSKLDERNIFPSDLVNEFADDNSMYGNRVDENMYKTFKPHRFKINLSRRKVRPTNRTIQGVCYRPIIVPLMVTNKLGSSVSERSGFDLGSVKKNELRYVECASETTLSAQHK
ncbi:hypothetical protein HELRODRAFT_170907 [Helobdella robusta]|uniref:E3 ubiquitin-protein ligase n=1 Tax=Helobdella robusta TaxID=6412 RepID=T1F3L0_HELRO|nr:hypothetical protein HELRODRAFT_170907 [Helobdella robusta]ESO06877.1 hypothetical protein HELRODRAFT_170907 [Helobdella robusta]